MTRKWKVTRPHVSGVVAVLVAGAVATSLLPAASLAQPSAQEMNNSNNPLTPALGLNLQDQVVTSYHEVSDAHSNAGLLRGILPHKFFGVPQIVRATVPIVTSIDNSELSSTTGLGDINIFDVLLFKAGPVELGAGPQVTFPSATDDRLGTEKWQAGVAAVAIAPQSWGLLGGLVTWQHSFAGDDDRDTTNDLQAQPFLIYNLPAAFYLRSTATWDFDLESGDYYIPIGLGLGKIWKLEGGTTINLFAEPQYTVAHDGIAPRWQVFMGLNLQFPLKRTTHQAKASQ